MELGDIEKPRETLNECQHHLDLLRGLRDTAGWDLLCRYFGDSAGHIEAAVLGVPTRPDAVYEQEFRKGQASALRSIKHYVDEYCETLEGNIQRITSLMRSEEDQDARRDTTFDYRTDSAIYTDDSATAESESFPAHSP